MLQKALWHVATDAGIVIDGAVRSGPQALAGEWGHMVIDPAGDLCFCGARGCVETFISGSGMERQFRQRLDRRSAATNDPRWQWSAQRIHQAFQGGDPECADFMAHYFSHFGRALANLIGILDPDIVVLGGGLSNMEELYSRGVAEVASRVFSDELTTSIVKNQLGDSAGVIGAALVGI